MEKVCKVCGKPVPKNRSCYCSSKCRIKFNADKYKAKHKRIDIPKCKNCGKPVGQYRRSFCSDECMKKFYDDAQRVNPAMKCLVCGRPLPKGCRKYCSLTCRSEASIRKNEIDAKEDAQFADGIQEGKIAHGLSPTERYLALNYSKQYGNSKLDKTLAFINKINMPYKTYRYWRDVLHRSDEEIEKLWTVKED